MPGTGTMTPIGGGIPGAATTVTPLPYTLLSIHRYAQIMGIPPLHFAGAATPNLNPQVFPLANCSSIWTKYDWQNNDRVSHMQLANEISEAETEISRALGYPPALMWIEEENAMYPRPYRRYYSGRGVDVSGRMKTVQSGFGKVIAGGQRAVTFIGTATVVGGSLAYTDEDADGYFETATITVPTALTDVREIKVYHTGMDGVKEWEIRPPRSKQISGANVQIIMDSWLFFEPALYELYPTSDGFSAIDASTVANFVTSVDVYREYNDTTQAGSQFIWENDITACSCGGVGCEDCSPTTQDGCLTVRNSDAGIVTPFPAGYDETSGSWSMSEWTECREPERVKIWYYAGEIDQLYIKNRSYDPLSLSFAQAIAWLTTARLDKGLCGCGHLETIVADLQRDMAYSSRDSGAFFLTPDVIASPFGTRKGEVMAWRRISKLTTRRLGVAVI